MPRRSILSVIERDSLLAIPDTQDELIRLYAFSEHDLSIIKQHRGAANKLGFAIQLCYMRYPGLPLATEDSPFTPLLRMTAEQLKIPISYWADYGVRAETRREHLLELQTVFGFQSFTAQHYQSAIDDLAELAEQTDKGIVLAGALVNQLRQQGILLPSINVIERICAEAITRANRHIHHCIFKILHQSLRLDPANNDSINNFF